MESYLQLIDALRKGKDPKQDGFSVLDLVYQC